MQPKRRGASSTVEDYLKCILLQEHASQRRSDGSQGAESRPVGMGTLGSELGVAPGTVTAMMKTLGESGLVDYEPYAGVRLTDAGRNLAVHVLRRHRLIELFLVELMGLSWSEVHAEAELLEHAVSDRLIERMDEMLGFPTVDPHGDPIPSVEGVVAESTVRLLSECSEGERVSVLRVLHQGAEFLRSLDDCGVVPGAALEVVARDAHGLGIALEGAESSRSLTFATAREVVVAPLDGT